MRFQSCLVTALAVLVFETVASPLDDTRLRERIPPDICDGIKGVVDSLKINKATSFCSSYLKIATATSTVLETVTSPSTTFATVTSTSTQTISITPSTGPASTSYIFLPGNPPSAPPRRREVDKPAQEKRAATAAAAENAAPNYLGSNAPAIISQACSCLSLATPTATITSRTTTQPVSTSVATIISTTTVTTTIPPAAAAVLTKTVYPCATVQSSGGTVLPSPGPAYQRSNYLAAPATPPPGLANGTSNSIYYLREPQGASALSCCNTCFFEVEYCVQAFWYSYQGCVVMQATDYSGSGAGAGVGGGNLSPRQD
ncbi:hypothetical protein GJ744_007765 [Endocarpon pusillum]|uniref:Apple domain-containing protein n=1 Tax=Endocarpon pusillum TaxID=364733 RepID=A0A8H7E7X0_9EURO|nr:hypothetical protein GJ744_007765 [Endocarpon pusillum]